MAINLVAAPPYDPKLAVFYGQLVNAAYAMYGNNPNNPSPPAPSHLPGNYKFVAWVQMRDFVFNEGNWTFYGLIAQNPSGANDYVLAIRGTSNVTEWWDDFTSLVLTPMPNFGEVGYGFYRIYQTLRVIYPQPMAAAAVGQQASSESLEGVGTFADQVAAAVHRHAAESAPPAGLAAEALGAKMSVIVAAHSLGSALATLYVAENSLTQKVHTPLLCTFASPRVGDPTFAAKFDGLGIGSWRIVNELDVVPKLPFIGFQHVATEHEYNSGWTTNWSLECWHSIYTYLHLLDPQQPLLPGCVWPPKTLAAAPLRAQAGRPRIDAALAAPAAAAAAAAPAALAEREITIAAPAGATINITIKVG